MISRSPDVFRPEFMTLLCPCKDPAETSIPRFLSAPATSCRIANA